MDHNPKRLVVAAYADAQNEIYFVVRHLEAFRPPVFRIWHVNVMQNRELNWAADQAAACSWLHAKKTAVRPFDPVARRFYYRLDEEGKMVVAPSPWLSCTEPILARDVAHGAWLVQGARNYFQFFGRVRKLHSGDYVLH